MDDSVHNSESETDDFNLPTQTAKEQTHRVSIPDLGTHLTGPAQPILTKCVLF